MVDVISDECYDLYWYNYVSCNIYSSLDVIAKHSDENTEETDNNEES